MSDRLPWFRCFPSALLGAIAGMQPDEGYVYVTVLLRIYETGGAVAETARTLSRRTGLPERKVTAALDILMSDGKVQKLADGRIDSASTHGEIKWQNDRRQEQSKAGKASASKRPAKHAETGELERGEKSERIQQNETTTVERASNHKDLEGEVELTHVATLHGTQLPDGNSEGERGRAREAADASRGDAVGEPGDRPDSDPSKQAATKAAEPVDDWPKDYREKFWNAYPVKVAKRKAFGQLETLRNGRKVRFSDLMAGLERYKRTKRHDREWCHPTTWLSQGRWEDETIEQPVRIPPPSTESYRRERPRSNADIYTEIALEADERIRRKRDAQQRPIDGQVIPISSRFGDQEHRYPDASGDERTGANGGQLSFECYSSLRRSGGR
jgi:hypothetical protein